MTNSIIMYLRTICRLTLFLLLICDAVNNPLLAITKIAMTGMTLCKLYDCHDHCCWDICILRWIINNSVKVLYQIIDLSLTVTFCSDRSTLYWCRFLICHKHIFWLLETNSVFRYFGIFCLYVCLFLFFPFICGIHIAHLFGFLYRVVFFLSLYTHYCQCLSIVHSRLPLLLFLTFM